MQENSPQPKRRGRPAGPTAQGRETRDRLYEVALQRFARDGFEATTLRDIAADAGVSPGLLYRYFASKEAVLLAIYDALSAQFAQAAQALPRGSWRSRVLHATRLSLRVLGTQRPVLHALLPVLLGGGREGVLGAETQFSRDRVHGVFVRAVQEADDAPEAAEALGTLGYLAHLAVIQWWLLDRSPEQRATEQLLAAAERGLPALALLLRLSATQRRVVALRTLVGEGLGI